MKITDAKREEFLEIAAFLNESLQVYNLRGDVNIGGAKAPPMLPLYLIYLQFLGLKMQNQYYAVCF